MWLEYIINSPFGQQTRYYWTPQTDLSEAVFDCKSSSYHEGNITAIQQIEKPDNAYTRALIAVMELKRDAINNEINMLKGYIDDSSE